MSEENKPKFQVFTAKFDAYFVLGHTFENIDHGKMGTYYEVYEKNQVLRDFAAKYSTPDNRLVGIIYKGEQGDDFVAGAIVEGVTEAPEGAELMKFPASEFLVTTHDYTDTEQECYPYIGMTVGYAHSENAKIPRRIREIFGTQQLHGAVQFQPRRKQIPHRSLVCDRESEVKSRQQSVKKIDGVNEQPQYNGKKRKKARKRAVRRKKIHTGA